MELQNKEIPAFQRWFLIVGSPLLSTSMIKTRIDIVDWVTVRNPQPYEKGIHRAQHLIDKIMTLKWFFLWEPIYRLALIDPPTTSTTNIISYWLLNDLLIDYYFILPWRLALHLFASWLTKPNNLFCCRYHYLPLHTQLGNWSSLSINIEINIAVLPLLPPIVMHESYITCTRFQYPLKHKKIKRSF